MQPQFEDESPVNPFDFWEGVNFKLKARQVDGYRNYDKSEFESTPTPIAETDEEIEAIWSKQHSLAEIVDPKNFKSYDDLKAKLMKVLGENDTSSSHKEPAKEKLPWKPEKEEAPKEEKASKASKQDGDDADEDLEFFKNFAE